MSERDLELPPLDRRAQEEASRRQNQLTKPRGSLGQLEDAVASMAAIQARALPASRPAALFIAASDHAVTRHGVSAYPAEVTRAMIANLGRGGAAATVMAKHLGVPAVVLDVGVASPSTSFEVLDSIEVIRDPVADVPLGDLRAASAVGPDESARIRRAAANAVDRLGAMSVLAIGEIGIGNTTAAAAVVSAILEMSPDLSVGPGTGLDPAGMERKRAVVRHALTALGAERDPWEILRRVGGRDLIAMAAAAEAAMARRIVVLADGYVSTAAMLALSRARPDAAERMLFAHRSAEPAHRRVLDALGARPLLDLDMRLGEGTGALAALPLLDLACALHRHMATFSEASVPDRD